MIGPVPNVNVIQPVVPIPAEVADGRHFADGRRAPSHDGSAEAADAALKAGQSDGAPDARHHVDTIALCRLLGLLADKTRLRILWLLAGGERAVGTMTAELALPQPTVSHHLAWLRTMHLVSPRRAGKNVFYALGKSARVEPSGSLALLTSDTSVTIAPRSGE